MFNLQKLVNEWSDLTEEGYPILEKEGHIVLFRELLSNKYKLDEEVIDQLVENIKSVLNKE